MKNWVRRLRGIMGSGLIWGTIWSAVGAALGVVVGTLSSLYPFGPRIIVGMAMAMGFFGTIAGASYAILLFATQGRRTLANTSSRGAAAAGLIGGFLAPGLLGVLGLISAPVTSFLAFGAFTGLAGAAVATLSLAAAKSANLRELSAHAPPMQLPTESG